MSDRANAGVNADTVQWRLEYRLVRESSLVGRSETTLESEARARALAASWKDKTSPSTKETAFVERRLTTPWERMDV